MMPFCSQFKWNAAWESSFPYLRSLEYLHSGGEKGSKGVSIHFGSRLLVQWCSEKKCFGVRGYVDEGTIMCLGRQDRSYLAADLLLFPCRPPLATMVAWKLPAPTWKYTHCMWTAQPLNHHITCSFSINLPNSQLQFLFLPGCLRLSPVIPWLVPGIKLLSCYLVSSTYFLFL